MTENAARIKIKQAQPLPLGAWAVDGGIRFAVDVTDSKKKTCLVIRKKNSGEILCEVTMNEYPACGNICAVLLQGFRADRIYYEYVRGGEAVEDIYGMKLYGSKSFGVFKTPARRAAYEPWRSHISWEGDERPRLAYNEMIMYKLHVRGFSKHPSSGVAHKGTFAGIGEKIDYFKDLGINALVLMPVVDFAEVQIRKTAAGMLPPAVAESVLPGSSQDISTLRGMVTEEQPKLYMNCWGYGGAHFFAPKASYAFGDSQIEFCQMVKKLHENGIEVILELLFPERMEGCAILDCLRHWAQHYHVDGFWLNREIVPVEMAAKDPMLSGIKLICSGFDTGKIYGNKIPEKKILARAGDDFQNTMRCYLKGDGNCLDAFVQQSLSGEAFQGAVHYITNNNGFTLADLVAYNEKHNEDNGEENRDGSDYNNSWNCGREGRTRSRRVLELRRRQMYNAMIFLLFSQGTPMIYGGDEFGNSQKGNNNAYCHDNELFWLNWRDLKKNRAMYDFVKSAVALRKSHPVLHPEKPCRRIDYLSCGFPDVSVHGYHPWKASFGSEDRYIGLMYCGKYARVDGHEDHSFYFAYNMHWKPAAISLPALPKGQKWKKLVDTSLETPFLAKDGGPDKSGAYEIAPRTIQIFMSVEGTVLLRENDGKKPAQRYLAGKSGQGIGKVEVPDMEKENAENIVR